MEKFKVGIIEGCCPEGAELVRILLRHPMVELFAVSSSENIGRRYSELFPGMLGIFDGICLSSEEVIARSDIVFGTPEMRGGEEIAALCIKNRCVFIDLAPDFRLNDAEKQENWYGRAIRYPGLHEAAVYSIPELTADLLQGRVLVACAGARPTAAALALAPLLASELIEPRGIIIDAKIGYTGADRHDGSFCDRHGNVYAYACEGHRHEPEIEQILTDLCGKKVEMVYIPHSIPLVRGAYVTCYARKTLACSAKTVRTAFDRAYVSSPFVRIMPEGVQASVAGVVGTNMCDISYTVREDSETVIICAALDPLIKGSAGQAVQSMNLMLSMPEDCGFDMVQSIF